MTLAHAHSKDYHLFFYSEKRVCPTKLVLTCPQTLGQSDGRKVTGDKVLDNNVGE